MMSKGVALAFTAVLSVLFLSSLSQAQSLNSCEITNTCGDFEVRALITKAVPCTGDGCYCGNPDVPSSTNNKLLLVADQKNLIVEFVVEDPVGAPRDVGAECFLNCPAVESWMDSNPYDEDAFKLRFLYSMDNPDDDPSTSTDDLTYGCGDSVEELRCDYLGNTGRGSCTFTDGVENSRFNDDNVVSCRFYDQRKPDEELDAQVRTFRLVDYDVNVPPIAVTVGARTTLPISIRHFGLIDSSYTSEIIALNNPWFVDIDDPVGDTEDMVCGETEQIFPSLTFLNSANIPFTILTGSHVLRDDVTNPTSKCNPVASPSNPNPDEQCEYLNAGLDKGVCSVDGFCVRETVIQIDSEVNSLPDYNMVGFLILLLSSSALFFFGRRKMF